uniref:TetR family transcriptional regulator n=1 Tax=Angiostrongylus cantonensis TaxID=6313 RepID=A0A0K0D841_ANGCA
MVRFEDYHQGVSSLQLSEQMFYLKQFVTSGVFKRHVEQVRRQAIESLLENILEYSIAAITYGVPNVTPQHFPHQHAD